MNDLMKFCQEKDVNVFFEKELFKAAIEFAETKKTVKEKRDVIFNQLFAALGMQRQQGICIKLSRLKDFRLKPYKHDLKWFQLKPLLIHLSNFHSWDKNEQYKRTSIPNDYKYKDLI